MEKENKYKFNSMNLTLPYATAMNIENYEAILCKSCKKCFPMRFKANVVARMEDYEEHYLNAFLGKNQDDYDEDAVMWIELKVNVKCPHCGKVHKYDLNNDLIDPNIAYTIENLNNKGYITEFCCEGHEEIASEEMYSEIGLPHDRTSYSVPYIRFTSSDILQAAINVCGLPEGWNLDEKDKDDLQTLYADNADDNRVDNLNKWVDSLPMCICRGRYTNHSMLLVREVLK